MAGPSIGTWVKVRNKSGRMTSRVIANKFGGGSYEQGQVITQSEYEGYKKQRAEAIAGEGKNKTIPTAKKKRPNPEGESALRRIQSDIKKAGNFLDDKIEPLSFDSMASRLSRKEINALGREVGFARTLQSPGTPSAGANDSNDSKSVGGVRTSKNRTKALNTLARKLESISGFDSQSLAKSLTPNELGLLADSIQLAKRFGR